jgi:hypothetical protein
MGMYTQVRGFLCCNSIDQVGRGLQKNETILENLKSEFMNRENLDRTWVCKDTVFHAGSNGSGWLFIGSEHKNYDDSIEDWLRYLIENIPCEGRIEFQYEECSPDDEDWCHADVWLVSNSDIKIEKYKVHTYGYGFEG